MKLMLIDCISWITLISGGERGGMLVRVGTLRKQICIRGNYSLEMFV